jgi:probable addiction module antidote protein
MIEVFQREPDYALSLLNDIFEDGDDQGELLIFLRYMTKAFGGVQTVAQKAALNGTQLYRTLSAKGNPELKSLVAILRAMNMKLVVQRIKPAKRAKPATKAKSAKSKSAKAA